MITIDMHIEHVYIYIYCLYIFDLPFIHYLKKSMTDFFFIIPRTRYVINDSMSYHQN